MPGHPRHSEATFETAVPSGLEKHVARWNWRQPGDTQSRHKLLPGHVLSDIEQPLPRRNLIYLAYILPEELENFSPEVCEALNERFDVSVHRTGHTIDAL